MMSSIRDIGRKTEAFKFPPATFLPSLFRQLILLVALPGMFAAVSLMAAPIEVKAPNGSITASFDVRDDVLYYAVSRNGRQIVGNSKLEIFADARMSIQDQSIREIDDTWSPTYGQFSTIRDHCRELTLSLTASGIPMTLLCRVFDDGLGIRFVASADSSGIEMQFLSEYKLLGSVASYTGERGRSVDWFSQAVMAEPNAQRRKAFPNGVPLVSVGADGLHTAFLESDLYSAAGFELMRFHPGEAAGALSAISATKSLREGHVTPWRVILVGDSAGDLVINNVAVNLAAPCKLEDTSWIKPGKGLWDWRIHGYDNGSFVYEIDTQSYLHMIDFCAEHGIEYMTIDDFWFTSASKGGMVVSPDLDIAKVMNYAKSNGVRIMLYYDRRKGDFGDETLFSHYANLGATSMKYGFMGNDADFTRRSIDEAAKNRLLINFHDGPVPMAGVERTMPNLITREFCHGQQDSRRAFTPESFLKMATVGALTGPLDMSNGNFGIRSINAGERKKGPRTKNSYVTTVVSEVARCLVIYSGIITLPDAPEEYLKKSDLFEFLKVMPATWDESRVPNSKIGKYITVARRSGEVWFVGSVNDQSERTLAVPLDFLEPESTYEATIYEDAEDTHGLNNPEAYAISKKAVQQGDVIYAKMAYGGGHAMIIRPVKNSGL